MEPELYGADSTSLCRQVIDVLETDGELDERRLVAYFGRLQEKFDAGGVTETAFRNTRAQLGRIEAACARAGYFTTADDLFRRRMEITRQYHRFRFREHWEVSALIRRFGYWWWLFSSHYGTSVLRLAWFSVNVMLWFSVVYFVVDIFFRVRYEVSAFAPNVLFGFLSYFFLGIQGFFPGTALTLSASFTAQILLLVENIFGAILLISLVTVVARRVWRGAG
ncbi:MAG: hypothetical protein JSW52_12425 [Candidatus Coatesbacteria bacterium]|nr:MAG: hypothetical protein JSW52_12425 [Candidatus Coatesbacteria bacterium]